MAQQTTELHRIISKAELKQHDGVDQDAWIAVNGIVYNVASFAALHPGGSVPLLQHAGTDATDVFYELHRASVLQNPKYDRLKIGSLQGSSPVVLNNGTDTNSDDILPVPYGEALGFWRMTSPYYNDSHHRFRAAVRSFFDAEVRPSSAQDDELGVAPSKELNMKMGKAGIISALFAAGGRTEFSRPLPGGVSYEEFNEFHELIISEEVKRLGTYGLADGLLGGNSIGMPPVLKFGSPDLIRRVAPGVLSGEKRAALCISEPFAGSDVAHIQTKAHLSPDKSHYTVVGVKKWITGGMFAEYFTTLCHDASGKGMVLLLIERDDSVSTKPIKTSYSPAAGTAYVEFDHTKVPVANVIGSPGLGFYYAMANFNKERWGMVAGGNRLSRLMVEECFKWACQRKIFGKRLIDQPVIRLKLASMAAEVESVHSFLEDLTYQMTQLDDEEAINKTLAGPIALLKYRQTRAATLVADNACQIFGGRALTRTGMGQFVEKFNRSYKMQAILGGSEEIMADFAIRQALKKYDATTAKL